jgi:hypothetical protein
MKGLFGLILLLIFSCSGDTELKHTVAPAPWAEELGNHRAVMEIRNPADAVYLHLPWRRHDPEPANKKFLIIHEATGDTIPNIFRVKVNQETCDLIFGPVRKPGIYFFYYLPFQPDPDHGFFRYGYLLPESPSDNQWLKDNDLVNFSAFDKLEKARCRELQARTDFDSFYPMEIIPTAWEKKQFLNRFQADYLVFPENRENPIRMRNEIPFKWVQQKSGDPFEGAAFQNEYFAFQLGLYAVKKDIEHVRIKFSDLQNGENTIPATAFTCFNTDGVDPYGDKFTIRMDVRKSKVKACWIGLDIDKNVAPGMYSGKITVVPENAAETEIPFRLKIINEVLDDRGDGEPWRHSRIRWLNSTLGLDFEPVFPFIPVSFDGKNKFQILGKDISMTDQGMPSSIKAWGTEILHRPLSWALQTPSGMVRFSQKKFDLINRKAGMNEGRWVSSAEEFNVKNTVRLESDGYINFKVEVEALKNVIIDDFSLEIPFRHSIAKYMMGMGLPGTSVPDSHIAFWEGPQDSFWMGNPDGGLHCELRGDGYHGPLLSLYQPPYPESWYNNGKGNFQVKKLNNEVIASIHTGKRAMSPGQNIIFEFSLIITPVRELNTESQFKDLYYQNYPDPVPDEDAMYEGIKIINVHHANRYNPYINYPFVATGEMKEFMDHWHKKSKKVKIYYTVRELSARVTELWMLRSLGHEILEGKESTYDWLVTSKRDKGHPWLIEHMEGDYAPAWYSRLDGDEYDAAVVTTSGFSRWYNYYIEGLGWLVENIDIDGLYLDDVAYDRRILKRMRKVLDQKKPGCIIDLHSNRDFSKGPALQYAEYFPYIDKLWFGEAFHYDEMSPANWLVEVSGIPFGLMGDMLEHGGNRWLGMLFGMTNRPPWSHSGLQNDPVPLWIYWDKFGIAASRMVGFWEADCPVRTDNPNVLATVYIRNDRALIALGSWEKEPVQVQLKIDWEQLGFNKDEVNITAPFIKEFQPEQNFNQDEKILVEPLRGWLLTIEPTGN